MPHHQETSTPNSPSPASSATATAPLDPSTAGPSAASSQTTRLEKFKGYVGVFVVLLIAGFLLFPSDSRWTLGYQINFSKSYIENTHLSELVALNWRTRYVDAAMEPIYECNRSISLKKSYPEATTERRVLEGCDRFESLHPYGVGRSRVLEIDAGYQASYDKLSELRAQAQKEQRLDAGKTPFPTPEMTELEKQLVETMDKNIQTILMQLYNLNLAAHGSVLLLAGLCLWYRRSLGAILLAPFAWMISIGKGVHEKI